MSDATYDDLRLYTIPKTDDPVIRARRAKLAEWAIEAYPETREKLIGEGRLEGRFEEARSTLRDLLKLRHLALSAEQEARIDACTNLDILHRWRNQAVVAAGAADALR